MSWDDKNKYKIILYKVNILYMFIGLSIDEWIIIYSVRDFLYLRDL